LQPQSIYSLAATEHTAASQRLSIAELNVGGNSFSVALEPGSANRYNDVESHSVTRCGFNTGMQDFGLRLLGRRAPIPGKHISAKLRFDTHQKSWPFKTGNDYSCSMPST
jgi:hypothetical protein